MGENERALARLSSLLRCQSGVVSRQQVLDCGVTTAYARSQLRRRRWVAVHRGVYVAHTGQLTWIQRAWCAVLDTTPSALSHDSALDAVSGNDTSRGPIHVSVDGHRNVRRRSGVVVHYRADLSDVALDTSPPRVRTEETVLDVASGASTELRAVAHLSDAVQSRITTADRLLEALARRGRIHRASFLREVLTDVAQGACSVLEHAYLTDVERAHGLPTPVRQAPTGVGRPGFRDADYPDLGLVVELDGRLGHVDPVSRDLDLERDLDAAVHAGRRTLRLGWGQVLERKCSTALKIALVLAQEGWTGRPQPCARPDCALRDWPT